VLDLLEPIMRHFRRSIQWQCHRPRAGVVPDRAAFTPLAWCSTLIGPASTKSASTPSSFGIPGRTILLTSSAASKTSASAVKESPLRGLALNHGLGSLIGADVLETPPPPLATTKEQVRSRGRPFRHRRCICGGPYFLSPQESEALNAGQRNT
jgi:hypothetical protein